MNVLIPWEELEPKERANWYTENYYEKQHKDCTRPLTADDVRGMIRMPNEWTEEEYEEHRRLCYVGNNNSAAIKVIELATRAAPEPDPWEEMDSILSKSYRHQDALQAAWDRLKATRGDK